MPRYALAFWASDFVFDLMDLSAGCPKRTNIGKLYLSCHVFLQLPRFQNSTLTTRLNACRPGSDD